MNNTEFVKEKKKKLAVPLVKKKLPAEGCLRRNAEQDEGSGQKKISDGRQY